MSSLDVNGWDGITVVDGHVEEINFVRNVVNGGALPATM
jgi:hypothetical protein